jgi:Transposase DDE domain
LQELEELQERKQGEQAKSKARVSSSDPQARVMHQSDGGLALSYNAQISADAAHGLIVGVAVTQEVNDYGQLLPAVERIEQRLEKKPQQMVADAGYTTRETIEAMAERKIDFLGSLTGAEKLSRADTTDRLPPSAFVYDRERDCFVCPEGKLLGYEGRHAKKKGFTYYRYEAEWRDCQGCARKPQCCPENQKQGRSVVRGEESAAVLAFHQKMSSEEAQAQYRRRGRVVEFCHAWIKSKLGLRQFHVRGLVKVQMEMLWACLTYNLQHWIRLRKPATTATS